MTSLTPEEMRSFGTWLVAQVLPVVLDLTNWVHLSWWVVLIPAWIFAGIILLIFFGSLVLRGFAKAGTRIDERTQRRVRHREMR